MAINEISITHVLRNDISANWASSTYIPKKGEPCVEFVPDVATAGYKVKTKYGDGIHTFSELPYAGIDLAEIPLASATVDGLLSKEDFQKIQNLGALANKDVITEAELGAELKAKIDGAASTADVEAMIGDLGQSDSGSDHTVKSYVDEKIADVVAGSIDGLGALASKDKVAETDLEDALATKINAKAESSDLTALTGRVTTLEGADAGKSVRTIASEELAAQLIPEAAKESLDTLAEIAAWIQSHPDDASAMNQAIADLETLIGTLPEDATATTIVGYIKDYADAAVAALKIGDYAKAADLTAAVGRIDTLEQDLETLQGSVTDLGALAHKDTVATADIDAGAVTDEKLDTVNVAKLFVAEGDTWVLDGGSANG